MPTIFSHTAVPLAIGLGLGPRAISRRLLLAGVCASMLPDIDVLAFKFGIAYSSDFGHRGFSHSLMFALIVALIGSAMAPWLRSTWRRTLVFLFVVRFAWHPGCVTNGGLGVALLWPFSSERFFAPFQVIRVSPIGLSHFLSGNGGIVLMSELVWVWCPCIVLAGILWTVRYLRAQARQASRIGG